MKFQKLDSASVNSLLMAIYPTRLTRDLSQWELVVAQGPGKLLTMDTTATLSTVVVRVLAATPTVLLVL